MFELLETLCAAPGPSGSEDTVACLLTNEIGTLAECRRDNLGNLIAFKRGEKRPAKRLMVCAHMDEVGLMITGADENGFLKFDFIGGVDPRVVMGRRVLIGKNGLPGVIGAKVWHLCLPEERKKAPSEEELFLDIGAASKEEALKEITIGDTAVFDAEFARFGDGFIKARALDDRAGCALLLELLRTPLPYDTTFVFSVQEEVGARGARAAAFSIDPDVALVVETTTASDIPFTDPLKQVCKLGDGPVLSFMDRATLYPRTLFNTALSLAKERNIPCQLKQAVAGGNDAGSVHQTRGGIPTLAVSLPCRYLHSPSCIINEQDAQNTLLLLRALCETLPADGKA